MDALFIVVAELLVIPLVLWGLIALELTVGVVMSIVSVLLGRRTLTDAIVFKWRTIRRRLLWSAIFFSAALLLADLVFFDAIVTLALGSADDRDDLDVTFAEAEGSFILGRIELHGLTLAGTRGGTDPSASFEVTIDSLVIDIDTARLFALEFAVEEIAVDGVRGRFDRLRAVEPEPEPEARGLELSREFSVARMHVGGLQLQLTDATRSPARELGVSLDELDVGPLHSESALFDLLYRARGRGAVSGHPFVLTATEQGGVPQSTLEVHDLPLDALGEQLEQSAGVRARGSVDLTLVNRHVDGPPEPGVELDVALQLRGLELDAAGDVSMRTKLMLEMAERTLARLGDEFPLEFRIAIARSELLGLRSLAESGLAERVANGVATALRERLREPE